MKKSTFYSFKTKFNAYYFIALFTVINLIQIYFTELTSDEAYYWFYSSQLEWGYYDHPPMIALLTRLGTLFFNGELGVRLFNMLLFSGGLFFLFKLLKDHSKNKRFIFLLLLSIPLFNYISFIIFPDTALVAFSIFALYAYKQLLEKNTLRSALLFGLSLALMYWSKYHSALFVFFILLSNLKLLKNKNFYIAIVFSLLLFLPHLIWLYVHDFVSLKFHLSGRASSFRIRYALDFISQQIGILGFVVLMVPFVYKAKDQFERALKFIIIGTLIFFLLSSLRGLVHIHWTSLVLYPLILLTVHCFKDIKRKKLFIGFLIPFCLIIFTARAYFAFRIFPVNALNVDYYHGRELWAEDIDSIAGERPVLFQTGIGALREASLYRFYSDNTGIALYPGDDKKSQYQLWHYEDSVKNRDVLLIISHDDPSFREFKTRMGKTIKYKYVDDYKP